jgi:hypothetical protein
MGVWAMAPSSSYLFNYRAQRARSNLSTFPSAVGAGTLQIKTFLSSMGTSACEVDNLQVTGKRH